jgi:DNA modification methylase
MGSGSAGVAAVLEGFDYIGIELNEEYHPIAVARIEHAQKYPEQWNGAPATRQEQIEAGQCALF